MEINQSDNIWIMLRKIDLKINNEINAEFLCAICKKLMIIPQIGPCGCRYCLECISHYLNGKENTCPGETERCFEVKLNFNENIQTDHELVTNIMKLMVKCPDSSCKYTGPLQSIPDHLKLANHRHLVTKCPYFDIGCKEVKVVNDEIREHLQSEILLHSTLMTQWMNNLTNEMASLKNENICLKERIRSIQIAHDERDEAKDVQIRELQMKLDEKNLEIIQLQESFHRDRLVLEKIQRDGEANKADLDKAIDRIVDLETRFNKPMEKTNAKRQNEAKQNIKFLDEFLWKGDKWCGSVATNINSYRSQSIFSEPFFCEGGYKMCLQICYNNYSVYVYCCLMRGASDDELQWPFKHDLTIDVVHERTGKIDHSKTILFDGNQTGRKKPTHDKVPLLDYLRIDDIDGFINLCKTKQISIICTMHKHNNR